MEQRNIQQLVKATIAGERTAFDTIVCRFQDMAFAVAFGLLGEPEAARDAAQDAFIEAYLNLGSLRDAAAFPGWFRRIILNRAERLARSRRPTVPLDAVAEIPAGTPDLAEYVVREERRTVVRAALNALPEEKRAVISLCYLEGLTGPEAAAFLDLPLTTLKKRLHDARRRLRERLEGMTAGMGAPNEMTENLPSQSDDFGRRVAFFTAVRTGDLERIRTLAAQDPSLRHAVFEVDVAEVGYYWPTGMTPLQWAAFTGNRPMAAFLLQAGADVNATGRRGMSPLHLATLMRRPEIVELLLAAGADVNAGVEKSGQTALHLASQRASAEIAVQLRMHGASVDVRDSGGRTPADWAEIVGRSDPPVTAPEAMLETGLKIVDLLCPFTRGGRNGIFTPLAGVGKFVSLCHLARIMVSRYGGRTVCVLRDEGEDTGEDLEVQFREMGIYDAITVVHEGGEPLPLLERGLAALGGPENLLLMEAGLALLPGVMERLGSVPPRTTVVLFGDLTLGAEPEPLANLDAALTFDVARARAGLFPAVDIFRSYSRLPLGAEHARAAAGVRRTLRRAADLHPAIETRGESFLSPEDAVLVRRAERLSHFLAQPIRGAEPWTNRPGTLVSLSDTIQGCLAILNGACDATPIEELNYIGGLLDRYSKAS